MHSMAAHTYTTIIEAIVKGQQGVIGPVALEVAQRVGGIVVDGRSIKTTEQADTKESVDQLVSQFETLFGKASVAVCKEAAHDVVAQLEDDAIPQSLR